MYVLSKYELGLLITLELQLHCLMSSSYVVAWVYNKCLMLIRVSRGSKCHGQPGKAR
jgi:hypothetical protein